VNIEAKFLKVIPRDSRQPISPKSQNDEVRLYELSEPVEYADGRNTRFVIVAAINGILTGPETHIYPATKSGNVLDWSELPGSVQGEMNCDTALQRVGWKIVSSDGGEDFPPKELVQKCFGWISYAQRGSGLTTLKKAITTHTNMVALALIPGGLNPLGGIANKAVPLRIVCWILGFAILLAGLISNHWILFGIVLVFIAERKLASLERQEWLLMAAFLLAAEMLANDFAGWGGAYPQAQKKALELFGDSPKSEIPDFFFPRRVGIPEEILKEFGPHAI
jgi:hypothetical protein